VKFGSEPFDSMISRRISIVTETYVPDVNGVAISLRYLIDALVEQGMVVQLIRTRPRSGWTPVVEEVWCRGLTIPMYPDLQIGVPSRNTLRTAWESFQPELVYIVTEGPLGNSALKLAEQKQLPVLSAFHTNFHRYSSYYGLGWIKTLTLNWLRRFHNRTGGTLVPAMEIAELLRSEAFERVSVLPHGVDCSLFQPRKRCASLRQQWGVSDGQRVLLYVGRIAAEKNIPLAIDAYQQARQAHPDVRLVMVGDGPLRPALEKAHPDIIFAGVQTGETLAHYFASADVFVFPSLTETFGLVTLEAMASGLPVIAFDMAAAHQYVTSGEHGLLAEVDNHQAFTDAVSVVLEGEVAKLGQQARQKAETLSWSCVGILLMQFIEAELERHHSDSQAALRTLV